MKAGVITKCFQSHFRAHPCNSPTDVTLVLSHAQVSLHVVPGVSQLSRGKVADLTPEGLRSCKTKYVDGAVIFVFERKSGEFNTTWLCNSWAQI